MLSMFGRPEMQEIKPGGFVDWAICIVVTLACGIGFFVAGYYAMHS